MENKLVHKAQRLFQRNKKRFYQAILGKPVRHNLLFIVGCQRSGTSMLLNIFDRDLNTRCYGEFSKLASNDSAWGIRLNSLDLVKQEFSKVNVPFIIVKPLVESQNILELLSYFENSSAIWMFRNYRDVALSNIKHFGANNGLRDLTAIVNREPGNWRSEKVSNHVRNTISEHFSSDMDAYEAAVLFWFARNSLYFELKLHEDPRVMLCSYEDLVLEPGKHMRLIYQQLGEVYPAQDITSNVHSNSRKKGKLVELSPAVEHLAQALQNKLEAEYRAKTIQLRDSSRSPYHKE